MDKLIKKISKEIPNKGNAQKDLKHLAHEDKKRDKVCNLGKAVEKKMMKKKSK